MYTVRLASPTESGTPDHTGEIISFTAVGSGGGTNPRAWYCYTNDPGGVKWLFPDGSDVPIGIPNSPNTAAVDDELFISGRNNPGAVILHRGPTHFSPDGKHCCVRNNDITHRICVTFSEY